MKTNVEISGHAITVVGRLVRLVRLRDEYHDFIQRPDEFLPALTLHPGGSGNLFTFIQSVADRTPRFAYHLEWDAAAVLPLTTYDHWWRKQINDKTRNMIRKAAKSGVEIRQVEFSDELVADIASIYNETPIRQGRRFKHFGKSEATIKKEHVTFLGRSDFFGAYHNRELVGFIKLVHGERVSSLMQIISKVSQRDKAPTNALIAKAVECCTSKGTPFLHYGTWSRRSMGEFKKHHAFQRFEIPRYYVPLNLLGRAFLKLGFHRSIIDRVPENWLDQAVAWRNWCNFYRYRGSRINGAVAQLAERHA